MTYKEVERKGEDAMKIGLRVFLLACLLAIPTALLSAPGHAESTLEKILKEKKIRVAIDVANPPFGVLDKAGQPDGSDVAVARALAKDLGAKTEFVKVPSTGCIPELM